MKQQVLVIWLLAGSSCHQKGIKYTVYANGELAFEILPKDIVSYDTTQTRGNTEIHEIRLRDGFYEKDSIALAYPIEMVCTVDGKKYFFGEHFYRSQSSAGLGVNFHFDPDCENDWAFSEGGPGRPRKGDTIILYTNNACNSIELFHRKNEMEHFRNKYYKDITHFLNYVDTARLAHEILLDPYYLRALEESGVPVK